jgi:hypothetical protein
MNLYADKTGTVLLSENVERNTVGEVGAMQILAETVLTYSMEQSLS